MTSAARSTATAAPDGRPTAAPAARLAAVPHRQLRPARAPFVGLVIGLLAAALLGLLLLNTQIARNSFTVGSLQDKNAALDVQQQQLQAAVDANAAPNTLAARAGKLGMVPAGQPAFIRLPDGAVLGVPKPAVKPKPIRIKGVGPLAGRASPASAPAPAPSAGTSSSPAPTASGIAATPSAGATP